MKNILYSEIILSISEFAKFAITGLIDALFLIFWVILQWFVQLVIGYLKLTNFDFYLVEIFRCLFAISTLIPITIFIYRDIRIMWIRVNKEILNVTKDNYEKE